MATPHGIHLTSTRRHSCDRCFQAFPIFCHSSCVVYWTQIKEQKTVRPGNELRLLVVCLYACTSNLTTSNLMATALNLSGFTNCSPIFASVIIIGVVLVTFGVLIVAVAVGIKCCLNHINKGAEQYVTFYDILKHAVYLFVVSCPDPSYPLMRKNGLREILEVLHMAVLGRNQILFYLVLVGIWAVGIGLLWVLLIIRALKEKSWAL